MRAIFGVLSLLVVVAIVGLLVKKQLSTPMVRTAVPATSTPGTSAAPPPTPKQQVEQFKTNVDAAVQQARPMPDDTK
ncbi:MAG TPA: hypothetical protein VHL79_17895 [Ramlibacter sp.]|jgi:hypothetical protein|nr:hypothetical protein [Ramlibacter sp.]